MKLERIKELLRRSPGIREDVVADLRVRIIAGVYRVAAEQVAEKIIQEGIYILGEPEGNGFHAHRYPSV